MSSDAPKRSSRSKGSLKRVVKREPRHSNASKSQSLSSMSVQAPSSRMDFCANQSNGAEKLQVVVGAGYDYRYYDIRQYAARPSTNASGNGHSTNEQYRAQPSISVPDNRYHNDQLYEAQIAAGIVSLGIDVSPALQLSLADQHGGLRARGLVYSTTKEGAQFVGESRDQDLGVWDESLQYEPCVELGYGGDGFRGDLSGVGSQFDSPVDYYKYL